MKKFIPLFLCFLLFSGCGISLLGPAASIIGQTFIMWKEGEAHKYYNLNSETMYRAAKRTASELGYIITNDTDRSSAVITANGTNTITVAALLGGTDNDWDINDEYYVRLPVVTVDGDHKVGDTSLTIDNLN